MSQSDIQTLYWGISVILLCISLWLGPMNAVRVGRRLNNEKQKDNAKRSLFLTLFALRGSPLHHDFVKGLNEIDVVFQDTPAVLTAWHKHFRDLHDKGATDPLKLWEVGRIELLSHMAVSLGYNSLNQTDIMQHYYPEGHGNKERFDFDLRMAALKYFEIGKVVYEEMLNNTPSYTERVGKEQNEPPKEQS